MVGILAGVMKALKAIQMLKGLKSLKGNKQEDASKIGQAMGTSQPNIYRRR